MLGLAKVKVCCWGLARLSGLLPRVQPGQLYGIEVNTYAHELASVVVWM